MCQDVGELQHRALPAQDPEAERHQVHLPEPGADPDTDTEDQDAHAQHQQPAPP